MLQALKSQKHCVKSLKKTQMSQKGNFASLSGDDSKTAEAKELVFVKIFAKGYWGLVPVSFFGGRSTVERLWWWLQ